MNKTNDSGSTPLMWAGASGDGEVVTACHRGRVIRSIGAGTGIPVLHRFLLGGTGYKLLDYEPCDESPFAVFEIDPEPHAFFGRSIYDLIKNEQDVHLFERLVFMSRANR